MWHFHAFSPSSSFFIFSVEQSFICIVSLCTSFLRRLAVCNTAQLKLCWWILLIPISGTSLLSTHSTTFVISTACTSSNCIRTLMFYFLRIYKLSKSAFLWCCQWTYSSFYFFLSRFCSSSWSLWKITKFYRSTRTVNDPFASRLSFALHSVPKTKLILLKHSFFNFSFSILRSMAWLPFVHKYIYAALGSSSLTSSNAVLYVICFGT